MATRLAIVAAMNIAAFILQPSFAREVVIHPLGNQEVVWEYGRQHGISRRGDSVVTLSLLEEKRGRIVMAVSVHNASDESVTISEESIQAEGTGGAKLEVLGYEAASKREGRRRFWEKVGVGLAAAAQGYTAGQAGYSSSTSDYSGSFRGTGPSGNVNGTFSGRATTRSYDPAVAAQAQASAMQSSSLLAAQTRAEQEARSAAIESEYLTTHTIRPGDFYTGRVEVRLPRSKAQPEPFGIYVDADVRHEFLLFVGGAPSSEQIRRISNQIAVHATEPVPPDARATLHDEETLLGSAPVDASRSAGADRGDPAAVPKVNEEPNPVSEVVYRPHRVNAVFAFTSDFGGRRDEFRGGIVGSASLEGDALRWVYEVSLEEEASNEEDNSISLNWLTDLTGTQVYGIGSDKDTRGGAEEPQEQFLVPSFFRRGPYTEGSVVAEIFPFQKQGYPLSLLKEKGLQEVLVEVAGDVIKTRHELNEKIAIDNGHIEISIRGHSSFDREVGARWSTNTHVEIRVREGDYEDGGVMQFSYNAVVMK